MAHDAAPDPRGRFAVAQVPWLRVVRWLVQLVVYGSGVYASYVFHMVYGWGQENWQTFVFFLLMLAAPIAAIIGAIRRQWLRWMLLYVGVLLVLIGYLYLVDLR